MSLIFIVDIDGTVADTTQRIDEIVSKYNLEPGAWRDEHVDEFTSAVKIKTDKLIPGAQNLPEVARICRAKLIFLTGRSNRAREATRVWLKHHLNIFDSVPLVMRHDGDFSDPVTCKENVFREAVLRMYPAASFVFFDDDEELLLRYSKYGLALKAPECWDCLRFLPGALGNKDD
jgi:hypothetical protein